jgi:hypothetical protein
MGGHTFFYLDKEKKIDLLLVQMQWGFGAKHEVDPTT